MGGRTTAVVVFIGVLLGWSVPAQAATVTAKEFGCNRYHCADAFIYEADPGEHNRLHITTSEGGFTFADDGASIRPGPGCAALSGGAVQCRHEAVQIGVRLGDGDDHLDASPIVGLLQADGGPGRDELLGGRGSYDTLAGGAGADVLRGGPGDDALVGDGVLARIDGGAGPQPDAPAAPDFLDGGEGGDGTSYASRSAPVSVDLERGIGGTPGEADTLTGVESAFGGRGDDSLRGTPDANALSGGPGRDAINGAAGGDRISGGAGHDLLRGGAGDDEFGGWHDRGGARDADRTLCGPGQDSLGSTHVQDYVSPLCERVGIGEVLSFRLPLRSLSSRGFLLNEFFCPDVPCSRTITVRLAHRIKGNRRGALLGRSVFRARGDRKRRNLRGVRFTPLGRRVLSRTGGVLVRVRVAHRNTDGNRDERGFTTRLALVRP